MKPYEKLLEDNKQWAAETQSKQPDFFKNLVNLQTPEYLWIGCSDSRVPANQIFDLTNRRIDFGSSFF